MATTTRTIHGTGRPQIYVTEESLKRKSIGATTYTLTTVAEAGADFETDPKTKDANLAYVTWGTGNDAKTSNGKITDVAGGTYTVDIWQGDHKPTDGKEFFSYKMRYVSGVGTVTGELIGTGDGAQVTFAATLANVPVIPFSVTVTAGAVTGTDDGAGNITGAGISSGTITYSTGTISVTFTTAPGVGVQVLVDYKHEITTYTATGLTEAGASFTTNNEIRVGTMVHATWTIFDASGRLTNQGKTRITEIVSNTELKMEDGWEADGQPPNGIRFWIEDINVELPIPQNDGEIERYQPDRIIHKLGTGKLLKENKGYRATFELDYSSKVVGDTLLDLRTLLNEFEHGDLFFKPRSDNPRVFNVFLTEDEITLGLIGPAQGHKGLILRFESTELTDGVVSKLTGWCIDYATWTND